MQPETLRADEVLIAQPSEKRNRNILCKIPRESHANNSCVDELVTRSKESCAPYGPAGGRRKVRQSETIEHQTRTSNPRRRCISRTLPTGGATRAPCRPRRKIAPKAAAVARGRASCRKRGWERMPVDGIHRRRGKSLLLLLDVDLTKYLEVSHATGLKTVSARRKGVPLQVEVTYIDLSGCSRRNRCSSYIDLNNDWRKGIINAYVDGRLRGLLWPDVAESFSELVKLEAKLQTHLTIVLTR